MATHRIPTRYMPNWTAFPPPLELDYILSTFNKLLLTAGVDIAAISTTGAVDWLDGADIVILGAVKFTGVTSSLLFSAVECIFKVGAVTVIGVALYMLSHTTVGVVMLPTAVMVPPADISPVLICSQVK